MTNSMTDSADKETGLRYMVCVGNDGYPSSLQLLKLYPVLPGEPDEEELGVVRVIDESGEDYLYPSSYFEPVGFTEEGRETVANIWEKVSG